MWIHIHAQVLKTHLNIKNGEKIFHYIDNIPSNVTNMTIFFLIRVTFYLLLIYENQRSNISVKSL